MKPFASLLLLPLLLASAAARVSASTPTHSFTPTASSTRTITPDPTISPVWSSTATPTRTATATSSTTPTPSRIVTATWTATSTPAPGSSVPAESIADFEDGSAGGAHGGLGRLVVDSYGSTILFDPVTGCPYGASTYAGHCSGTILQSGLGSYCRYLIDFRADGGAIDIHGACPTRSITFSYRADYVGQQMEFGLWTSGTDHYTCNITSTDTAWHEWSANLCMGTPRSAPIVLNDRIVQAFANGIVCASRYDGRVLWRKGSFGGYWNPPAYDADRDLLYQAMRNGAMTALRPADGSEAWHYYEGQSAGCNNVASCTYWQDKVYVGTGTGRIVCLDADTRTELWGLTVGARTGISTPALDNGELYVATQAGEIFRLNALTGAISWQISSTGAAFFSAVSLDDTRLYLMTSNGKVECRSRSNGALLWSYQTGSWTLANLSVGPAGVFCSSDDRCIYRLDPTTGAVLWQTCFAGNFARSAPFCAGDMVFGSGCAGLFYGVDAGSGAGTWNLNHGPHNTFTDFAEADGLLFVCNLNGVLFCLRPDNVPPPPTVTVSATMTPTATPTATMTSTETATATASPTASATPSASGTPSASATPSATATASATPTVSSTSSATSSPTPSQSASTSPTPSPSFTTTVHGTQAPTEQPEGGRRDPGEKKCYVAPNPVHGGPCRVVYRMRKPGTCRVRIFQASGDPVGLVEDRHDSAGLHSSEISTQHYAPGVYFCRTDLSYDGGDEDKLPLTKILVLKAR